MKLKPDAEMIGTTIISKGDHSVEGRHFALRLSERA